MKKYFLFACVAAALVSCSSDDFFGETGGLTPQENEGAILFQSVKKRAQRATHEGADAAALLNNTFYVSGVKGTKSIDGEMVFDNYTVKYEANTANTTESNTANWEYVGVDANAHATTNGITQQTIKYWDYSKAQYDFIAYAAAEGITLDFNDASALPTDANHLAVSPIVPAAGALEKTTGAYKVAGTAADLSKFYISDLETVYKAEFNNTVQLTFRSLGTKVRIALYETVPGYSVKDVKFYTAANTDLAGTADDEVATLFTTTANQIFTKGTYTVYYPSVNGAGDSHAFIPAVGTDLTGLYTDAACTTAASGTADGFTTYYVKDNGADTNNNQAHLEFTADGTQETKVGFGTLTYVAPENGESGDSYLGRTSNTASFATGTGADENNYYNFIPNEAGTTLNLRVDYTLESIDGSKEEIVVRGATAQVPVNYTQWKAGYAYTYLFKITDKTNGHTGAYNPLDPEHDYGTADPVGLYPITFDAVVVNDEEDNTQETITTVAKPSITTYQKNSKVVSYNEYDIAAAEPIYVDVVNYTPGTLADGAVVEIGGIGINADGYAQVYELSKATGSKATLTEACVIDALNIQEVSKASTTATITGRNGLELKVIDPVAEITTAIPYADGNTINMTVGNAVKFTPATGKTYAFVYAEKASTTTAEAAKTYQATKVAANASVKDLYKGTYTAGPASDVQKGVKYFKTSTVANHTYEPATPYLGTGVSKMYVLEDGKYVLATGYAKTGTTYYTTSDNGLSYHAVRQLTYAQFLAATDVYSDAACTGTPKVADVVPGTTAWYWKDGSTILPVVVEPQQASAFFVVDEDTKVKCADTELATDGIIYYDLYNKYNGQYAVKVIKVQ